MDDTSTDITTDSSLQQRRVKAVRMRLDGAKLSDISRMVGLSQPTIISAHKAFLSGGWAAVNNAQPGRSAGSGPLGESDDELRHLLSNQLPESVSANSKLWTPALLTTWLSDYHNISITRKTAGRQVDRWQLAPTDASGFNHLDADQKKLPKFKLTVLQRDEFMLFAVRDARRQPLWIHQRGRLDTTTMLDFLDRLLAHAGKPFTLLISGININAHPEILQWFDKHQCKWQQATLTPAETANSSTPTNKKTRTILAEKQTVQTRAVKAVDSEAAPVKKNSPKFSTNKTSTTKMETHSVNANSNEAVSNGGAPFVLDHLDRLEAESIRVIREAMAEGVNPVMLFSMGKDSIVLLHLAKKACYPASLPFPLMHIDTQWKFHTMYEFRENIIANEDVDFLVHANNTGIEQNVNPLTHGAELHTSIMKTDALKQAIDKHGFDIALAGSRRDEEASRSKERVFSFRNEKHQWDPKNQRPEVWNLYNTMVKPGETLRVYPLSNWTEIDIWEYIQRESITVPSLYFAAERPVVERDGMLIMVDDDRLPLQNGEVPTMRQIRFRTLGCYPLTGAFESTAADIPQIINELQHSGLTERSARLSARLTTSAMEKKKIEGYF